jgi:hypothetical protein
MKSERLKKLEMELQDLQQWERLGLVPKKDLEKHKIEVSTLSSKIEEEKEKIRHLKESGETPEFTAPKKNQPTKQVYQESDSIPDIDEEDYENDSFSLGSESEDFDASSLFGYEDNAEEGSESDEEEDEDPFSDRNRWKRGILEDPEADNW